MQKQILTNLLLIIVLGIAVRAQAQKPVVVSVDKGNASSQEAVTINGSDFGTDPAKIKVFFGGAAAQIKEISNQQIEVRTPFGATYDNISVTNTTLGLTGYHTQPFFLNYSGEHGLEASDFSAQTDFQAESGLYDLCLCDFNGDSKLDVISASDNSNSLSVFQNAQNTGTPETINLTRINSLINAKSLHATCGDLNGDGRPDLVISEGVDGDRLFIYRNTGTGTFPFSIQSVRLNGRQVKRVVIADLDLDGKPELVVTDKGSSPEKGNNLIAILPNKSTLSSIAFDDPVTVAVPGAESTDALEIRDVNGNGLPDIITTQFQKPISNIFICDNKSAPGTFNFSDVTTLALTGSIANIRAGDLDGDDKPDIAATRFVSGNDVVVFLNQSNGTAIAFSSPASLPTAALPWGLDLGDLDGDGKIDIAAGSIKDKVISILNNESTPGTLSFRPKVDLPVTYINRHIKIGDINGDGKPDLTFTSINDNINSIIASKISVIRNISCFVPVVTPREPLTICSGTSVTLTSITGGGATYDWKKDGTTVKSGAENFVDANAAGTYTVTALSEGGACSKTSNEVVISVAAPGAGLSTTDPDARSNSPVCTKDVLNLQVNDVGATEYRWRGPNGFTATGRTPSRTNFTLENTGDYIVEMIAGGCVAKTDTVTVEGITNPDFTISFSGSPLICQGSSKLLSVSPLITSGFSYQWKEKTSGDMASQTNATFPATATGEYSVKVTSAHPGCSPVETPFVKITTVALPEASFTAAPTPACTGQAVTFTNATTTDPAAAPSYEWTFGDTHTSTETSPQNTYAQAGTFQVKLKVTYAGGACPDEEIKSIEIVAAPPSSITSLTGQTKLCEGDTLRLTVTGDTFTSYTWSTGETTPTILIDEAKEYGVTAVNEMGCNIELKKTIDQIPAPVITATANPAQIKVGQNSKLSASGSSLENYLWRPGFSLNDSTLQNVVASPLITTTYTVTGTDINGCKGQTSVEVMVLGTAALDLIVPKKYFSPNGDNINQYWVIDNINSFPTCQVEVYDGHGAKIFESKPYANNWDGTYKGSKLPGGVYYYVIRCDGEAKVKTGSITLLK